METVNFNNKDYALYKGDRVCIVGKITDIQNYLGVTRQRVLAMKTPRYHEKNKGKDAYLLYEVEDDINMDEMIDLIEKWAVDRGLDKADNTKQLLKLGEEFGELCEGLAKDNYNMVIDSIGDMFVVMAIFCLQSGLDFRKCVEIAYNEIKDRKGQMVNGVFVKEDDLKGGK